MWNQVGHKAGKAFRCDLCGHCRGSLCKLIPHLRRRHRVAEVEPHFGMGLLYGVLGAPADATPRLRAAA